VGARFSASVHTGTGAHQAYYTMGTGSFPGVKRTGRGVDHPLNLAPMLKSRVIHLLPSRPSKSVLGRTLTFTTGSNWIRGRKTASQELKNIDFLAALTQNNQRLESAGKTLSTFRRTVHLHLHGAAVQGERPRTKTRRREVTVLCV
jgi:hypothetical protein